MQRNRRSGTRPASRAWSRPGEKPRLQMWSLQRAHGATTAWRRCGPTKWRNRMAGGWKPIVKGRRAGRPDSFAMRTITIRRPDDWHVHFRDGPVLKEVVPYTARAFGRAIIMPNLTPPVTTAAMAAAYRDRVRAAVPEGLAFTPLMTCYLTDSTDAGDLIAGHRDGVFTAAKLYPAHATTNSAFGVTAIETIYDVLGAMAEHGMPLLVHGEVTRGEVDIFDREKSFIDEVLVPVLERWPRLKVVMEHITTRDGAELVRAHAGRMGGTITPQHLLFNRNMLFQGGIRPHMYCLPVLKREK